MEITEEILNDDGLSQLWSSQVNVRFELETPESKSKKNTQFESPKDNYFSCEEKDNLPKQYGKEEKLVLPKQRLMEKYQDLPKKNEKEEQYFFPNQQQMQKFPDLPIKKKKIILTPVNIAIANELTEIEPNNSNPLFLAYATKAFTRVVREIKQKVLANKEIMLDRNEKVLHNLDGTESITEKSIKLVTIVQFLKFGWENYKEASQAIYKMRFKERFDSCDLEILHQYYFSLKLIEIARAKIYTGGVLTIGTRIDDFPAMQIEDFKILFILEQMIDDYASKKEPALLFGIFLMINNEYPKFCNLLQKVDRKYHKFEFNQELEEMESMPTHNDKCLKNNCVIV